MILSGTVHTRLEVHRMDLEMSGLVKQPWCYELKFLESDDRTTLVLSNIRELNRELFYKLVYLI